MSIVEEDKSLRTVGAPVKGYIPVIEAQSVAIG